MTVRTNDPTKVPSFIALPREITPGLRRYLESLEEAIEIRLGRRGDSRDRAITLRELIDSGLAEELASTPFNPNQANQTFSPTVTVPNLPVPPAPTSFTAAGAYSQIILTWDISFYQGHALTELWRHDADIIGDAVLIGVSGGGTYVDPVGSSKSYYYWARHVNSNGVYGPWHAANGVFAETAVDVEYLLDILSNSITTSELSIALNQRLDDADQGIIDLTNTYGSTSSAATSAAEALASAQAAAASDGSALSAAQAAAASASASAASESSASNSATLAAGSASAASGSASGAAVSAGQAAISASDASGSASAAAISAGTAAASASAASVSEGNASTYAGQASSSASDASGSASQASTSAGTAASSASAASLSAGSASTYATNASTSASDAAGSANVASTQAGLASTSASNASGSASSASVYAGQAAGSAVSAEGYASSAATALNEVRATATGFDAFYSWPFNNSVDGWTTSGVTATTGTTAVTLTSTGTAPRFISPTISLVGSTYNKVRARVRRTSGSGWRGNCYYTTASHSFSTSYYKVISDSTVLDEWRVLEWDMAALNSGGTDWTSNTITMIRLDMGNSASDTFEVDWVVIGASDPGAYSAAIQTEASVRASETGDLFAQYTVKVDVNGAVAGYGLASEVNEYGSATSSFGVNANRFYVTPPTNHSGPTAPSSPVDGTLWFNTSNSTYNRYNGSTWVPFTPTVPFIVQATDTSVDGVTVPAGVYMDAAYIKNASITAAKIGSVNADTITSGEMSANYIKGGTIDANSVTIAGVSPSFSIKSASSGQRLEMNGSVIRVYDSNGYLRVKLGNLA